MISTFGKTFCYRSPSLLIFNKCMYPSNLHTTSPKIYSSYQMRFATFTCTGSSVLSSLFEEPTPPRSSDTLGIIQVIFWQLCPGIIYRSRVVRHVFMVNTCHFYVYQIYICLTSVTRAKPKEKNKICRSISTHAVKCDGVFFELQHGFQCGFQHA